MASANDERLERVKYLEQRIKTLKSSIRSLTEYVSAGIYQDYGEFHEELADLNPEHPLLLEFATIESSYYEAATKVTELQAPADRRSLPTNSTANFGSFNVSERQMLPKLKEIPVPSFDGDHTHWAYFKNKFIALVHSRDDISDAVKCSQLLTALTGNALEKVNHFDPSDEDYPRAWKTLLDFYDHKRITASHHLNALLDLPKCSQASAEQLAKLLDGARQHLHILERLGLPNIADTVPSDTFPRELFDIPKDVSLADPQFHLPKPVDLLLASNTTFSVLCVGQIHRNHRSSSIILQKTSLGWVVAGGSGLTSSSNQGVCNVVKLDKLIERFWIIEDFDHEPCKSRDEKACEQHYVDNTTRDPSTGRYVVRLPFRDNKFSLGESKQRALRRFYSLERRFSSDPTLKAEYSKVMDEYISLGHMTLCTEQSTGDEYFLPHHAVVKESSETTKLRVVFDASAKTSTNLSLNDVLMVGPTIQNTIFEQLLRFRTHQYVLTGDIEKMYRQILVHPDDRRFQKVFWYHEGKLAVFHLNTVTFGVACAPFLAIRTIHQLARDEAQNFPRASELLFRDFYVDDFISGANSLENLISIRDEMISLLKVGGFLIRKWSSNHPEAFNAFDQSTFNLDCLVKGDVLQKTLGIVWHSQADLFGYSLDQVDAQVLSTKRKLVSELAKIFDPLGLVGPVILYAKVLIQDCWKAKINWDDPLPQHIHTKWKLLANQLPLLKNFSIPRQFLLPNPTSVEIHGFCDASQQGYGACLFARSTDAHGAVLVRLICSKSKVAPLGGVTIPRLELCAATLVKKLLVQSKPQFDFPIHRIVLWSDSTIVLCWLRKAPHLLRTFESNRVAEIQSLGDLATWRHVRSEDNPADALSRGQLPSELEENSKWIAGPAWLSSPERDWPPSFDPSNREIPDLAPATCLVTTSAASFEDIYSRFSSFERFLRVFTYLFRWKSRTHCVQKPMRLCPEIVDEEQRINQIINLIPPLQPSEIRRSECEIVKLIQRERFKLEFHRLETSTKGSKLGTPFDNLNPFIGTDGVIRVGGRLDRSKIPYDQQHPMILPQNHHVTRIIIRHFHETTLHAGVQTTHYAIRARFFILNGKSQVRSVLRHCVKCIRCKPPLSNAPMANLPEARVSESYAFQHTGVDFFGPLSVKEKAHKNRSFIKCYGCVFVCLSSKAVHIELATDLSSKGFLVAFRRFLHRRGVPSRMYSDNGTNFVGANKDLLEIYQLFETEEFKGDIRNCALSHRIDWHFNPPVSPHFGGLWEAAVKSFKHHLKRVVNNQFTYDQLETLLIEIEGILNSRPLCVLSSDPNDPLALTPAHLLIGRPINALPETSLISVPENRLSTYQVLSRSRQAFWERWHKEYLHELQVRQKWLHPTAELNIGDVVLLIEDNVLSGRWPLGVIIEVFPGDDGVIRVASVKTSTGIYKRNITRLYKQHETNNHQIHFDVNSKTVIGSLNAGIDNTHVNKMLAAWNMPALHWTTFKAHEKEVGVSIEEMPWESLKKQH
ncbi:uncharacterized protein LOC131670464 [Phymastichus coffea]|uniref:uncharacterized protein LOC131670464 n=1 Tax=Phymastichus coffea TaxID=108790 RepID=UPI00273BA260|nr:uncharacterized protein LOC131670464 [Phymastichus coffea]